MTSKILSYLIANDSPIQLYIEKDEVKINTDFPAQDKERSFCLTFKGKKKIFNKQSDNILISEIKHLKIFINNREIISDTRKISPYDRIKIDGLSFSLDSDTVEVRQFPLINVQNLSVKMKEKLCLNGINFKVYRGEFVVIMGPSGCGKSVLLDELSGNNNRVDGDIIIDNESLYENFHSDLKARIGYVPQFDEKTLHPELTVEQELILTSKIRFVTRPEEQVKFVFDKLGLNTLKNRIIRTLSGGQKKRVAIANELLDQPDIFLIDEPTSPLDVDSVQNFLKFLKKLAHDYNKAVVMVTHKPTDLKHADKVLFLATGGHQVFWGKRDEFIKNISQNNKNELDEDEVCKVYQTYSSNHKINHEKTAFEQPQKTELQEATYYKRYNVFSQFKWLTIRNFHLKFPSTGIQGDLRASKEFRDYFLQPFLVSLLSFAFPYFNISILFVVSLSVIWFGVSNSAPEIVQELFIFNRERKYNLRITPYLLSKVFMFSIISLFQIPITLFVVWFRFKFFTGRFNNDSVNLYDPLTSGIFLFILSLSSITLGLYLSAFKEKVEEVLKIAPLILIAQIVFAGLVSKPDKFLKENISYLMLGRWGLEGLSRIQDAKAPLEKYKITDNNPINHKDTTIQYSTPKGVVADKLPSKIFDTLSTDTLSVSAVLGAYNNRLKRDNYRSWLIFDSLRGNFIIIAILGLLSYVLCYLSLSSKDRIFSKEELSYNQIQLYKHIIFISILTVIPLSYFFKETIVDKRQEKINKMRLDDSLKRLDNLSWYANYIKNKKK